MDTPTRLKSKDGFRLPTLRMLRYVTLRMLMTQSASPLPEQSAAKGWRSVHEVLHNEPDEYQEPEKTRAHLGHLIPDWHEDANCKDAEDDVFFGPPTSSINAHHSLAEINRAKAQYCNTCPVFAECLSHSLTVRERFGIWAGTSGRTRVRIFHLIDTGVVSITTVVADFVAGHGNTYERRGRVDDWTWEDYGDNASL